MMLSMTSAARSDRPRHGAADIPPPRARAARRLVLVPSEPRSGRGDEMVRRYRLARLRLEPRQARGEERFAHLKNFHD